MTENPSGKDPFPWVKLERYPDGCWNTCMDENTDLRQEPNAHMAHEKIFAAYSTTLVVPLNALGYFQTQLMQSRAFEKVTEHWPTIEADEAAARLIKLAEPQRKGPYIGKKEKEIVSQLEQDGWEDIEILPLP